MNRKPLRPKSVRVPDALWDAAMAVADVRDEVLSEVIRASLERYVKADEEEARRSRAAEPTNP